MTKTLTTWNALTKQHNDRAVPSVRNLRNNMAGYFQYINSDGKELAVVNTLNPYGDIPHEDLIKGNELPLFRLVEQGQDWSSLKIPAETIAIKAATLGTGWRRAQLMEPVYERAGRSIAAASRKVGVPELSLTDMAMRRDTGEVLFVPPVAFHTKPDSNPATVNIEAFVASIGQELSNMFNPATIALYGQAAIRGYES